MAGKKYGIVIGAKVPGSYFARPQAEREEPGHVMDALQQKYAGKVDILRRLWTSAFTADISDIFVLECDDLSDAHAFQQELNSALATSGDPDRFGLDKLIYVGVNPDAS